VSTKNKRKGLQARWESVEKGLHDSFPHLSAWWSDEEGFESLRVMARADGTTLVVAKGFNGEGGPIVCFGSGYGVVLALMAVDATINAGNWRADKPWKAGD